VFFCSIKGISSSTKFSINGPAGLYIEAKGVFLFALPYDIFLNQKYESGAKKKEK
jgi:hypothetical protein